MLGYSIRDSLGHNSSLFHISAPIPFQIEGVGGRGTEVGDCMQASWTDLALQIDSILDLSPSH